mmetsp:Transcript_75663/g.197124  ORF Transcript_75663/g.197124 Transcript_75663/m.197124 type:complete len:410 (+) Transcript_75663:1483-2712(+)
MSSTWGSKSSSSAAAASTAEAPAAEAPAAEAGDTEAACRICFDGAATGAPDAAGAAGYLVQPCLCRGTQGYVHEACLQRWRRLQVMQGKTAAASRCEVCGASYAASLATPGLPIHALVLDVVRVVAETIARVTWHYCGLCSPVPCIVCGLLWFPFGLLRAMAAIAIIAPMCIVLLYSQNLRISVLGAGQNTRLGLTSFGSPVEGLSSGMLLVSISAGGPFYRSVLYVIQHSDRGSLAVILNDPYAEVVDELVRLRYLRPKVAEDGTPMVKIGFRRGGPVEFGGAFFIHNIDGVAGAERLQRGRRLFLNRSVGLREGGQALLAACRQPVGWSSPRERSEEPSRRGCSAAAFTSVSSWGEHQLEGEVRRGAWGWIRPEHVSADDVLDMDADRLRGSWERLIRSPNLDVFEG